MDTTNFTKIKSHFNHFLNIFAFFKEYDALYISFAQIYPNITTYEIKKCNFLAFDFFGF